MPGTPPPPTQIFKTPKIRPGDPNFKLKSTTSMGPTIQAAQPTQWDLAAPGVTPMKTNVAHDLGSHTALETLGLTKEAASAPGVFGAVGGLGKALMGGWGGKNVAGRTLLGGATGVSGSMQSGGQYMRRLMKTSPGAAAGIIGTGAAGAALLANKALGSNGPGNSNVNVNY